MATLPALVFDVNETLLDLDALTPHFERLFGRSGVLREWFAQLILYSQAITLTEDYVPFGDLGGAVLRMIGAAEGIHVPDSEIQMIKEAIATLPAHAEVPAALARLRAAGFRMFTLTNNPKATFDQGLNVHKIDGISVRIYGVARTIVDCFKYRNKLGLDIAIEALRFARARKRVSNREILQFARLLRQDRVMAPYLESVT